MQAPVDVDSLASAVVPRVGDVVFPPKELCDSLLLVPMGLDYPISLKFRDFVSAPGCAPRFKAKVLYGRIEGLGHSPVVSLSAETGLRLGWCMPDFDKDDHSSEDSEHISLTEGEPYVSSASQLTEPVVELPKRGASGPLAGHDLRKPNPRAVAAAAELEASLLQTAELSSAGADTAPSAATSRLLPASLRRSDTGVNAIGGPQPRHGVTKEQAKHSCLRGDALGGTQLPVRSCFNEPSPPLGPPPLARPSPLSQGNVFLHAHTAGNVSVCPSFCPQPPLFSSGDMEITTVPPPVMRPPPVSSWGIPASGAPPLPATLPQGSSLPATPLPASGMGGAPFDQSGRNGFGAAHNPNPPPPLPQYGQYFSPPVPPVPVQPVPQSTPLASPPSGMPPGHAPFVEALSSPFTLGEPEHWRFLETMAGALLEAPVINALKDSQGMLDYALLAEELDYAIAERAAVMSPPTSPAQLTPLPCATYTPFQRAMSAFLKFMRSARTCVQPAPVAPTASVSAGTPPPPHAALPTALSTPARSMAPPLALAGGKPSAVAKGCPGEAKFLAANAAILLDHVAASPALLAQLTTLDATARSLGSEALRAQLEAVHEDVRRLVESDVEQVDIGPGALAAAQLCRYVARIACKGARHIIALNEDLITDFTQAPNPQYEALMKHLQAGSLHLISEFHLSGAPNANKQKLFYGDHNSSNSRQEFSCMESRVRVVLEAFSKAHPNQAKAVDSFMLNFRKLARFAFESSISAALIYDFIWVPFWREYAISCAEAKEAPGGSGAPFIQPSRIAEGGHLTARLNNAYLRSLSKHAPRAPPPPPSPGAPPMLAPPLAPGGPNLKAGKGPPQGAIPVWNPQKQGAAGWVPLPSPRPPHNPPRQEMCRGWKNKGLCSYGQHCMFVHPGY